MLVGAADDVVLGRDAPAKLQLAKLAGLDLEINRAFRALSSRHRGGLVAKAALGARRRWRRQGRRRRKPDYKEHSARHHGSDSYWANLKTRLIRR